MNDFNKLSNALLYCIEQKTTEKGRRLRCSMSSKKEDGSYTKGVSLDVILVNGKCETNCEDFTKKPIRVSGTLKADEYTSSSGDKRGCLKIFADSVMIKD